MNLRLILQISFGVIVTSCSKPSETAKSNSSDPKSSIFRDKIENDFKLLQSALDAYKLNAGSYPTTSQGLNALIEKPTSIPIPRRWVQVLKEDLIDPWGHRYKYRFPGSFSALSYEVISSGSDENSGKDDISSENPSTLLTLVEEPEDTAAKQSDLPNPRLGSQFFSTYIPTQSQGNLKFVSCRKTDGKLNRPSSYEMFVTVDCVALINCTVSRNFETCGLDSNFIDGISTKEGLNNHVTRNLVLVFEKRESGWVTLGIK